MQDEETEKIMKIGLSQSSIRGVDDDSQLSELLDKKEKERFMFRKKKQVIQID
jgi:hypothetical protein